MNPCPHRVFGIRPCTRPLDHPLPHVGDFTPPEEPMTVRPRYTLRAKARDAGRLYAGAIAATLPPLQAVARAVVPALVSHTAWIARAGYVDPPAPPIDPELIPWLEAVGVDERDQAEVAGAITHLASTTGMPDDDARNLVCRVVATDALQGDSVTEIQSWGYPILDRVAEVRGEHRDQTATSISAGQVTARDLVAALTPDEGGR